MQTGTANQQRRAFTLSTALALVGSALRAQQSNPESRNLVKKDAMNQKNSPKKTHCLGRYLLDLPDDATIKANFKYAGGLIETRRKVTPAMFDKTVSIRESNLKNTLHKLGGTMLVGRNDLGENKVLLQTWVDAVTAQNIHKNETFIYLQDKLTLYLRNTESDATAQPRTIERAKMIAAFYRYRDDNEIPTVAGFCINSGLIASKNPNSEEVSANILFRRHPGLNISFSSAVTGNPSGSMLPRMEREMSFLDKSVLAAMTVLRKQARPLGQVEGEEFLTVAAENNIKGYQFVWESQGKTNSIEFPSMTVRLTTTRPVNNEAVDAPFKTDKEALEFWDDLLSALRLRPGAV